MGFQGFARDERFSDNQIRIDIASVIDSDLKEANRQSRLAGKNAAMAEKWNGMYLNAMINKHEVEKRNREENFAFFMKNREEIQKQVQYNNEVKYKDAGKDRHVRGLDSILGEGLFKLAVNVGSVAINKLAQEERAKYEEKKAEEKKQVKNHAESYHAEASDEQKRLTKEGFLAEYAKATAKGKKILRDYYNSQGKHQLGDIGVAYHNKMSGMETIEKLDAEFSKKNIAKGYLETLHNLELPINGTTVTFESLYANPHNDATVNAFLEAARTEYLETSGMGERGLPTHKNTFGVVRQQLEGQLRGMVFNSNVEVAKWSNKRSDYQKLEKAENKIDILFNVDNPQSIAAEHGMPYAVEFFKRAIKNGAFDRATLNKLYDTPFAPGMPTIWEDIGKNTARGREYAALWAEQVNNEQQHHDRSINEQNLKVRDFLLQLQQTLDPGQANHLFNSVNVTGSKLNKAVQGWTQTQRKELIAFLGQRAGIIPMGNVRSQAFAVQQKLFNQSDVNGILQQAVLDNLNATNQTTGTWKKANLNQPKQAIRNWLTKEVAASGLDNPQDIMNHINNIVGDEKHPAYQRLLKTLTIQTVDPTTKDPLKQPIFSYIEDHGVGNAPQETGVEQYRHLTGLANGKTLDLSEVYQTPEINSGMKPLLMRLKQAKKNGFSPQQIQQILANHMTPVIAERLKKGKLSVGMIVNEAIEHGDYKVDFQPLDANVFQDAQEIQALEQRIPNFSKMSLPLQSRLGQQINSGQGFPLNASAARTTQPSTWNIPNGHSFGKYGSKIPYSGDRDGQETGTDFRLPAGQGAPIRLPFSVTVMRTGTTGHPAYGLQGTSGRLGASGHGFGYHGAVKVRLQNGNEVELVIGHLDGMSPLANIPPGTVIPPGTIIGYQGASGRSLTHGGGPYDHLTIHTNGLNGYRSTPDDLMDIVHSLYFASVGGNQ